MSRANTKTCLALATLLLGGAVSGGAWAQSTWRAADSGDECNPGGTVSSLTCTSVNGFKATLQAWGYATSTGTWTQGALTDHNASGLGAYTGRYELSTGSQTATNGGGADDGQHAFDSVTTNCGTTSNGTSLSTTVNAGCGGQIEGMLIKFTNNDVNNTLARLRLTSVSTGWSSIDADLSIYRWDGASTGPNMATQSTDYANGTLAGWTLVNSNDMGSGGDGGVNPFSTNGANSFGYSSYFLITTYFGATTSGQATGKNWNVGDDRFKIDSFSATNLCPTGQSLSNSLNGAICTSTSTPPGGVPEPSSLALAGLALIGAFASRRKIVARR